MFVAFCSGIQLSSKIISRLLNSVRISQMLFFKGKISSIRFYDRPIVSMVESGAARELKPRELPIRTKFVLRFCGRFV